MACEFARLRGPTWRMLESSSSPSASTTAIVTRRRLRTVGAASFFTMSNSPLRGLRPRSTSRSRGAFSASGLSRRVALSPPHLRCLCRRFGGRRAEILGDSMHLRPRNEGAGGAPGGTCLSQSSRFRTARPHACAAWAVPRKPGRTPLGAPPWRCRPRNRSGPGTICGIRPGGCSRPAIAHGGLRPRAFRSRLYGPRSTPLPAPPAGSSPETAPHERGWQIYTTSSHRSQ